MARDGGEELRTIGPEARSELLRGQLKMWLRSFERFFRIGSQPLSERETRALAARNWSEELRLVDNVLLRVVQLSGSILSEEQVSLSRFDRYVESNLTVEEGQGLDP